MGHTSYSTRSEWSSAGTLPQVCRTASLFIIKLMTWKVVHLYGNSWIGMMSSLFKMNKKMNTDFWLKAKSFFEKVENDDFKWNYVSSILYGLLMKRPPKYYLVLWCFCVIANFEVSFQLKVLKVDTCWMPRYILNAQILCFMTKID